MGLPSVLAQVQVSMRREVQKGKVGIEARVALERGE